MMLLSQPPKCWDYSRYQRVRINYCAFFKEGVYTPQYTQKIYLSNTWRRPDRKIRNEFDF
jgi:hypothetical protein